MGLEMKDKILSLLKQIDDSTEFCPICKRNGLHADDCELRALIDEMEEEKEQAAKTLKDNVISALTSGGFTEVK